MTKPNSRLSLLTTSLKVSLCDLPTPASLSYFWNFGSCLGLIFTCQISSGFFLVLHYSADVSLAFDSLSHILRDVSHGWLLRSVHANGATFFFLCLYVHIGRGIYFGGYLNIMTWVVGLIILLLLIAISFLGYILPWGQISFWGATVITNLFSALPYFGADFVLWLWGGFSVDDATLKRFLAAHFLFPFILVGLVGLHLFFLHASGSSTPLGVRSSTDYVAFHNLYSVKDAFGFIVLLWGLVITVCFFPSLFIESVNFVPANPLSTPSHIVPEWYFLFAYAILRSISSKLGGVLTMFCSLLILLTLRFSHFQRIKRLSFYGPVKLLYWSFVMTFFSLTYLGACPVIAPFLTLSCLSSISYFRFFALLPLSRHWWDSILFQI